MCGIAGAVESARTTSAEALSARGDAMACSVAHRGPDDHGVWVDPVRGVVLAHRRLSILDVSPAGHQPMTSRSGRYVLVYNGEIYNYRDMRRDLERSGVSFRGGSDTEVLVESIAARGLEPTLVAARGMFALAVYDRDLGTLTLARDRLGEKPLYYGWSGTTFLFGSECWALRAHPDFSGEIDRDALTSLLRYSYIPSPQSVYAGIAKLTPGCTVTVQVDAGGVLPAPRPYWSLHEVVQRERPPRPTDAAAVASLDALLSDAVRSCMVSDVPIGAFLSGGVDSSTIVAMMQSHSGQPVQTYTVGFGEAAFDESVHARAVAEHLGTAHTELRVTPRQALDVIPDLPAMYDEPFADASQVPTALVSRLARTEVTVALSGDGGDELFGGYGRYARHREVWERFQAVPPAGRRAAGRLARTVPVHVLDSVAARSARLAPAVLGRPGFGDRVHRAGRLLGMASSDQAYQELLSHWHDPAAVVLGGRERPDLLSDAGQEPQLSDITERAMFYDSQHYLPDAVLAKVDRAAMAASLETRVPMLDHRVVEFAWQLPAELRFAGPQSKWLLRQVLDRYVPRELVDRPKMGFGVPISSWLRTSLRPWAEDLLQADRLRDQGLLDAATVRSLWGQHLAGTHDWSDRLWTVLMLQAWLAAPDHEAHEGAVSPGSRAGAQLD